MINGTGVSSVWGRASVLLHGSFLLRRISVGRTPVEYCVFAQDPGLPFIERAKKSPKYVVFEHTDGRVRILAVYRHVNSDMARILNDITAKGSVTKSLLRSYNPVYLAG